MSHTHTHSKKINHLSGTGTLNRTLQTGADNIPFKGKWRAEERKWGRETEEKRDKVEEKDIRREGKGEGWKERGESEREMEKQRKRLSKRDSIPDPDGYGAFIRPPCSALGCYVEAGLEPPRLHALPWCQGDHEGAYLVSPMNCHGDKGYSSYCLRKLSVRLKYIFKCSVCVWDTSFPSQGFSIAPGAVNLRG